MPPAAVVDHAHEPQASQLARPIVENLATALQGQPAPVMVKPANALVLSGGGQYAAYNAGLLVGWSEAGTRPNFDVVTGISSGAVVAGYAFLGKKYDGQLQQFFTTIRDKDLFVYRPVVELIRSGSLANPKRLEKLIAQEINDCYLFDLREAHKEGRRLYVGTMNVQTRRVVIWDVGAIACSDRPDAAELVRKIFLAAGSIPGLLPSVKFDVEVDGKRYVEEHVDGGAASQAFLRLGPGMQQPHPQAGGWLKGSNLYALAAGKLYADPLKDNPGFLKRVTSTISAALYALYRAELMGMYAFCMASGMKFHMIAIPQNVEAPPNSMTFEPEEMRKLFALGYDQARKGIPWRLTPPGTEPGEEEIPRVAPGMPIGGQYLTGPRTLPPSLLLPGPLASFLHKDLPEMTRTEIVPVAATIPIPVPPKN
jgi:hypothetical protein